jgi:hypothetical protein
MYFGELMRQHQNAKVNQQFMMRITLDTNSTALEAARLFAAHRTKLLGGIVSKLILKTLRADAPVHSRSGFPVFAEPAGKTITLEDVKRAEDEA